MTEESDPSIGRRAMIKRAAVAGAVAWTAPVIVDSVASPAAAGTAPVGANSIQITSSNTNCSPAGYPAANSLPSACISPSSYTGAGPVTFSVVGGCSCVFTAAQAWRGGGQNCTAGVIQSGMKSVAFPALPGMQTYQGFKFVLTCG